MTINVKDLDKEELLLTLYNYAKPLRMGFLQAKNGLMTREEARKELDYSCKPDVCYIYDIKYPIACSYHNNYDFLKSFISVTKGTCSYQNLRFDNLHGRPIKTDLSKDEIHLEAYKKDNAHVDIEKVINDLKEPKASTSFETEKNSVSHRPSKEQDYGPFFTVKIGELINKNSHTYNQDLGSTFVKLGLVQKCTDATYNDRTSKALLMNYDLYPWKWKENSEQAVKELCSLVKHSALEYALLLNYVFLLNLVNLHNEINPNLAEVDIARKCHDSKYNADYSKAKLVSYDLYPWGLEENSEHEVKVLCKIVGETPYMQQLLAESLDMSKDEL